jgi:primosomal protein N' (replication factor Y)
MPPTVRVAALEGDARTVAVALEALREAVPALDPDAVLGPIDREGTVRALVRFDYALGGRVTESLRASVVSQALKSRNTKGRPARPRNTLRVRVDLPDLDL